jgi:urea transport system permease protein
VLVNLAKTWLTSAAPETWLFVLGALFVLTTLVFPRGIAGLTRRSNRVRPGVTVPIPAGGQA